MATYTSNYQLHQWVAEDNFLRTDFNEDFRKIDEGIAQAEARIRQVQAEKCEIVTGRYTGTREETRTVSLPFTPAAVLVERSNGTRGMPGGTYGGLAVTGGILASSQMNALNIVEGGFTVCQDGNKSVYLNDTGTTYFYAAFR